MRGGAVVWSRLISVGSCCVDVCGLGSCVGCTHHKQITSPFFCNSLYHHQADEMVGVAQAAVVLDMRPSDTWVTDMFASSRTALADMSPEQVRSWAFASHGVHDGATALGVPWAGGDACLTRVFVPCIIIIMLHHIRSSHCV